MINDKTPERFETLKRYEAETLKEIKKLLDAQETINRFSWDTIEETWNKLEEEIIEETDNLMAIQEELKNF